MGGYLYGFGRALVGQGIPKWIEIIIAAYLGLGSIAQYGGFRDIINVKLRAEVMPDAITWQYYLWAFVLWIIVRLAHNEAMRYWRAARIKFGQPRVENHPLWKHGTTEQTNFVSKISLQVCNDPYKTDGGKDVEAAWTMVEIFELNFKPLREWRYARWEENKHPPYEGSPQDHFPHAENFINLPANRSAATISVLSKPLNGDCFYPLRGVDQLTGWINDDLKTPPGKYLVRVTIQGKGLQEAAIHIFKLKNGGAASVLEISEAPQHIGKYWP